MSKTAGVMVKRRNVKRQSKISYVCVYTYNMVLYKPIIIKLDKRSPTSILCGLIE
jgi:hypothetical protein